MSASTRERSASMSAPGLSACAITSATSVNSAAPKPRVASAGVPIRSPEAISEPVQVPQVLVPNADRLATDSSTPALATPPVAILRRPAFTACVEVCRSLSTAVTGVTAAVFSATPTEAEVPPPLLVMAGALSLTLVTVTARAWVSAAMPSLTRTLAEVLRLLGARGATVVYGNGLDEFTVCGPNTVSGLRDGQVIDRTMHPEECGVSLYPRADIVGGTPAENAEITKTLLTGGGTPAQRDIVALNAGAALRTAGKVPTIPEGVAVAREIMKGGQGWEKLQAYARFTRA